jgi:hypothetical protein
MFFNFSRNLALWRIVKNAAIVWFRANFAVARYGWATPTAGHIRAIGMAG